ncbi:MAG TPA: pseudouridine synthase [Steroidobacteraceae bacterium]|jgi:23S rRNA pseudouridine2605 synthase
MTSPVVSERLQKLLAAAGHGSRRQIEQWIRAGRLTVDGRVASLGEHAAADADIRLDGARLAAAATGAVAREVLIYHKPLGEVTTRSDPQRRPTVFERLPAPANGRWVVVGRLDVNTTGLLLFTNDGALAHRLMHPSAKVEREYRVSVRGVPDAGVLAGLRAGLMLEDGPARFESVVLERSESAPPCSHFRVILREGRNREVRRLWQAAGFEVLQLQRRRYGAVRLPTDLRPGQYRRLSLGRAAQL